jgi:phage terminase small subunit
MPRGQIPKPIRLHVLEGTTNITRHRNRLRNEPQPKGDLPAAPDSFTAGQREFWDYGLKHAPAGVLKAPDAPVYRTWCVACDLHRQMAERLQVLEMQDPAYSRTIRILNTQALIILRTSVEMGFSPVSRARIAVGASGKSADAEDEFLS